MSIITKEKKEYDFDDMFIIQEETNPYGETPDYSDLIKKIKNLALDNEKEADLLNSINLLKTNISFKKRSEILKKIDRFKEENHL